MMKAWMWVALLSMVGSVAMAGDRARCLPGRRGEIYFYPFQQDQPITQKLQALGFHRPGKVIPASNGVVYVADLENARILAIDLRSSNVEVLYHNPNVPEDQYWESGGHENISVGLSLDEKQIYITDRVKASVFKLDLDSRVLTKVAGTGLNNPIGVAASSDHSILILDRFGTGYDYRLIQIDLNDNSASLALDRVEGRSYPVAIDRLSNSTFVIAVLSDSGGEGWTSFYFYTFNLETGTVTPIENQGWGSHRMDTRFPNQAVFQVSYRYITEFSLNIADTTAGAWYKDAYIALNVLEDTDYGRFNQNLQKLRSMANDVNADPYDRFSADVGMRRLLQSRACFYVEDISTSSVFIHFVEFRKLILDYMAQGALDLVLRLRQAEYDNLYGEKGMHTLEQDPEQRKAILAAVARFKAAMPLQSTSYGWRYFALTEDFADALVELEKVEQALRRRLNWGEN